ncbi:MAG: amidohydrolase family protein [Chloroflexi bacterium]|nr:amidohydrolase family protein [Chloroflexota bacterium]
MTRSVEDTVLIRGARLVGEPGSWTQGRVCDVLVVGSKIGRIEGDIEGTFDFVINADGMILMPGMVDTHLHLWESLFRGEMADSWGNDYFGSIPPYISYMSPEDVYISVYAGAIELLQNGVTSVMDYAHCARSPEHVDAVLAALDSAGIRAVLGYDLHKREHTRYDPRLISYSSRLSDLERLFSRVSSVPLISAAVCLSEFVPGDPESMTRAATEIDIARRLNAQAFFHNNYHGEITELALRNLLGPHLVAVHGNYDSDVELKLVADSGTWITTQPTTEMMSGRRSMTMITRGVRLGVKFSLGMDVPAVGKLGILNEMRSFYLLGRLQDGIAERSEGRVPVRRSEGVPAVNPAMALQVGTSYGAETIGLGGSVGEIRVGGDADLVLIDTRPFGEAPDTAAHIIMCAGYDDIDTVMVAGKVRKHERKLVGVDLQDLAARRSSALKHVREQRETSG